MEYTFVSGAVLLVLISDPLGAVATVMLPVSRAPGHMWA
jgi:hypothetical protein